MLVGEKKKNHKKTAGFKREKIKDEGGSLLREIKKKM